MKPIVLTGQRFGRLLVLGLESPSNWAVRCDCGTEFTRPVRCLTSGHTKSCGCLRAEMSTTHGQSLRPEFKAWQQMIQRCTNPKNPKFKDYGGRGITVCDRWQQSYENFIADMGQRPSGLTLDRWPDNNGNYEPGNCRWATYSEQNKNRRSNGMLGKKVVRAERRAP